MTIVLSMLIFVFQINLTSHPSWCAQFLPFGYVHVQGKYWNVGFLQYYELKQIPNFILAFPITYFILWTAYHFITANKQTLWSLGFVRRKKAPNVRNLWMQESCFVYIVHVS